MLVCSGYHNKVPWTRWRKQQKCISHSLAAGKSNVKELADFISIGDDCLLAVSFLEGESKLFGVSSYEGTDPITRSPLS